MPSPIKCLVCGFDECEYIDNQMINFDDDLFISGKDVYSCPKCRSTQVLNWKATKEVISESEINPCGVDD